MKTIYLAMGCFWGAEKKFWSVPGVLATRVGYQGGDFPEPDYPAVCTGTTGHAEVVEVVYDPALLPTREVLRVFWENHDPTQGHRQGNDIGSQYRSAVYWSDDAQRAEVERTYAEFEAVLQAAALPEITTETGDAANRHFWPAEEYHQQYLLKNPSGYDCHAHTGHHLPL